MLIIKIIKSHCQPKYFRKKKKGGIKMLALLGEFIAKTTSGACFFYWIDEEDMPESLL